MGAICTHETTNVVKHAGWHLRMDQVTGDSDLIGRYTEMQCGKWDTKKLGKVTKLGKDTSASKIAGKVLSVMSDVKSHWFVNNKCYLTFSTI